MADFLSLAVINSVLGGEGVISNEEILFNEEIFSEKPLVFLQTLTNKRNVIVCGYCSRFVGDINTQMQYLARKLKRTEFAQCFNANLVNYDCQMRLGKCVSGFLSPVVECSYGCGEVYCGEPCREKHFAENHNFMCTGSISDKEASTHPLMLFKQHAIMSNEIFLMVGDLFAKIINEKRANCDTTAVTVGRYVRPLWHEAAVAPKGSSQRILSSTCRRLVKESWELLNNAFSLSSAGLVEVLSEDYLSRTIGMFEQNNVGVRVENPIVHYTRALLQYSVQSGLNEEESRVLEEEMRLYAKYLMLIVQSIDAEAETEDYCQVISGRTQQIVESNATVHDFGKMGIDELRKVILEILYEYGAPADDWEDCDDEAEDDDVTMVASYEIDIDAINGDLISLFPPLDGTAFYIKICKINHSCEPNVLVTYNAAKPGNENDNSALAGHLMALKKIDVGEELVQSYIDQNLSYQERSEALKDYGFICRCPKCKRESKTALGFY